MDFLIMVIAFYLAVGLFITYAALKDDQFTESIFELRFLAKIFVMIVCILAAPIILINAFMSDSKKRGDVVSRRAELRRTQREEKKANIATYNLTQAQLDAIVNEKIGKKIAETKQEIYEETVNTVMALVLTLPLEVLMDHYWQKSYRQRLPGFVDKVLEYYGKWQDGEIDMEDLKKDLWEFGGIRLEGATVEEGDLDGE